MGGAGVVQRDVRSTRSDVPVADPAPKSLPEVVSELWTLTRDYAKQETIDPLKGVGRYLGFGLGGAVMGGLGVLLLMFALLRALQTQTGTALTGSWSWVPYFVVVAVAGLVVAWAVSRISRKPSR
jgi:Putative Actinobacterial Holin-X, holin superfamily III